MEGAYCKTTRLSTIFPTITLSCAFLYLTRHPDQPPKTIRSQVGTWSYNQPELSWFHTAEGLTCPPAPAGSSEQLCPPEVPEEAGNWCGQRAGPAYPCSLSGWRFPYGCKIVTLASPPFFWAANAANAPPPASLKPQAATLGASPSPLPNTGMRLGEGHPSLNTPPLFL